MIFCITNCCEFAEKHYNYLLTYDSYVPLYNRFHRGEWITRVSGGEGALDTPGPLNGTSEASAIWAHLGPPMKSIIHGHIRISGQ
jgi:hypothetical protein